MEKKFKMKSKSKNEILLFLVKNSIPEYHCYPVSDSVKPKTKEEKLKDLLLRLSGNMRFLCLLESFEKFVGEKYNFEKHLRVLHDEGTLCVNGVPPAGSFYDSKKYRELFAHGTGLVGNSKTNITHIAFHYRENDFLKDYYNILNDAAKLGLVK